MEEQKTLHDRIIELHNANKYPNEIALECNVTAQTVRNHISSYTGKPKRPYKRSVLNCNTNQPYEPRRDPKLERAKSELKETNKKLADYKSLHKKSQRQNTELKQKIVDIESEKRRLEAKCSKQQEEYKKLISQYDDMKTWTEKAKIEGVETKSLSTRIISRKFKDLEKRNLILSGIDKQGIRKEVTYSSVLD
jgi:septal ring factor EnvC (AmiA/AmiB activator)